MSQPITSTLDSEQQRIAGDTLRATVVDLIDLSLVAKQAHWNVIGPNFRSVHLALDELVTAARDFTDAAAERATGYVVGGISPLGQKQPHRTVLDESALAFDTVYVSGGRRGLDVGLAPADLLRLTSGAAAPIAR